MASSTGARSPRPLVILAIALLLASTALAACGAKKNGAAPATGTKDAGADGTHPTTDTGTGPMLGGDGATLTLSISPAMPVATVTVTNGASVAPAITLTASTANGPVAATWSFDRPDLGSISGAGVFTPKGTRSGTGNVTATYEALTAKVPLSVALTVTQNGPPLGADAGAGEAGAGDAGPGGFGGVGGPGFGGSASASTVTVLQGSAQAPATAAELGWLYPYDQTVWPRGMLAPLLQWQTTHTATAVRVHLSENNFTFDGFYSGAALVNQPVDPTAWALATDGNGGDPLQAQITIFDGTSGTAIGPITESWTIAPGALRGTIYYSTYLSSYFAETAGSAIPGGAGVLAIQPGATSPTVAIPGSESKCWTCHSVSADGSTVYVTAEPGDDPGYAFDLGTGQQASATFGANQVAYMGAPYPNGKLFVPNSPAADVTTGGYVGPSVLSSEADGGAVATTGWTTAVTQAVTPSFAPNGQSIAFNFWAGAGANGVDAGAGHSLAVMDFSCPTADGGVSCGAPPYAFANLRQVYSDSTSWPSWPSFTPDNQSLVFQSLTNPGTAPTYIFTWLGAEAQLYWTTIPSSSTAAPATAAPLDALNGVRNGASYLPTSATHPNDTILNYEPTVNVIASGGYYWVVFTSRRLYGNVITAPPYDGPFTAASATGGTVTYPIPKKLWVAAIDINATPGTDRSHPAFYLPGQELNAINARGFWVLDPCKMDGVGCDTGDECCGGYCLGNGGDGGLTCQSQSQGCSQEFDRCMTSSDCCGAAAGYQCINDICSAPAAQ